MWLQEHRTERWAQREGDWDGDHWNDRRSPILQEYVHDADHEQDCDENRVDNLVNGLTHEGGRIVDVYVVDPGREMLLELRHLVPDLMLDLNHVRARRCNDPPGS